MADSQVKEHNKAGMRRLLDMYEVATALNVGRSTAFAVVLPSGLTLVRPRPPAGARRGHRRIHREVGDRLKENRRSRWTTSGSESQHRRKVEGHFR